VINCTVQFNYSSGEQITTITNRKFLEPVMNTTFQPDKLDNGGTKDNTTALPESGYICPTDLKRYRITAAYHSLGLVSRQLLDGKLYYRRTGQTVQETEATKTGLIDMKTYLPAPNIMNEFRSLYENIILSFFWDTQFLAVAWADDPSQLTFMPPSSSYSPTKHEYPVHQISDLEHFRI
jgi:hypothetical protein